MVYTAPGNQSSPSNFLRFKCGLDQQPYLFSIGPTHRVSLEPLGREPFKISLHLLSGAYGNSHCAATW